MKLDQIQRRLLANQMKILAKLEPENADRHNRARKAFERGYEREYAGFVELEDDRGLTAAECDEVYEILSMFEALRDSDGVASTPGLVFSGFSGNEESALVGYSEYILRDKGDFTSLEISTFNTGSVSMLPTYRRQLEAWRQSLNQQRLSAEDCRRIAAAAQKTD